MNSMDSIVERLKCSVAVSSTEIEYGALIDKILIIYMEKLKRFSFATAAEKQLKQRKLGRKHCFLVVGLEKVVFREGNCQGNRKLRADPARHFSRAIQRRN